MSEFQRPTYEDARTVEMLFDPIRFERLLSLAEAVCLRRPPTYPESQPVEGAEATVITALGVRGLRAALELHMGVDLYDVGEPDGDDPEVERDDPVIHPLNRPDYFNGSLDRQALNKVAVFGESIINEGYEVLGPDTGIWVERFKAAQTDDEQIEVLEWLDARMRKIVKSERGLVKFNTDTEKDMDDAYVYHPLRFSPKAIGSYPRHRLSPTCLGVSVITAGFLKRAEADFMNGGVAETSAQGEILDTITMIENSVDSFCQRNDLIVPDELTDRLTTKADELRGVYTKDRGTHTANYVRLKSGRWYQLDPNYGVSTVVPDWHVQDMDGVEVNHTDWRINEKYETLQEFRELAPGLELTCGITNFSVPRVMAEFLDGVTYDDRVRTVIDELLWRLDDESIPNEVRQLIMSGVFLRETEDQDQGSQYLIDDYVCRYENQTPGGQKEYTINKVFYETFQSFVLWDMPIDEWAKRCKMDDRFRRDRVEDIMRLPILMGIQFSIALIYRQEDEPNIHNITELGLPETRIGLSVLNNVALYLDDELSIHYWGSQWSSDVPVADRLSCASRSNAQDSVANNQAGYILGRLLQYASHYDRISSFMGLRFQNEDEDGTQSGECDGTQQGEFQQVAGTDRSGRSDR